MTSEEFWRDDPQLFVSYRTSFINKKKREMQEMDYKCWLQGVYVHDGNSRLFRGLTIYIDNLLAGIFKTSKNNSDIGTYPTKPYSEIERETNKKKENERVKKYQEFQETLIYCGTLKKQYLEKLKAKGE